MSRLGVVRPATLEQAAPPLPVSSAAEAALARFGVWAGALTLAGVVLSGPVALALVDAVQPQPSWNDAGTFADAYHWIQRLPYVFGLLLVSGSVMMVVSLVRATGRSTPVRSDLARVLVTVFAGTVLLNYLIQTTFVPALLSSADPRVLPLVGVFAMANPSSLAWGLEMWGYAFLGIAMWLVAPALGRSPLERWTARLIAANGVISVVGGVATTVRQGWVFTRGGLLSFAAWNVLMAVLAVCFTAVWRARLSERRARPSTLLA